MLHQCSPFLVESSVFEIRTSALIIFLFNTFYSTPFCAIVTFPGKFLRDTLSYLA